ncbi:uncharacterized protein NPIL_662111 [Nephila pilipes]|uniref:Gustatory receptor n=1 Tax=Nephila pilipes TaxID=299642 RepID=A0A8X6ISL5_NEPPI|nr:uncharacterized protein NPIL_662111 [Nephila pilipes]
MNICSDNSFLTIFKLIFRLFRFTGIEVLCRPKHVARNMELDDLPLSRGKWIKYRILCFIQDGCKYYVYIGFCAKILVGTAKMLYSVDKTRYLTDNFISLLTILFYVSVYRKRHAMSQMTETLSQLLKRVLDGTPMVKTYAFIAYLITVIFLLFIYSTQRYVSENYVKDLLKITPELKKANISLNFTLYYCSLFLGLTFTFVSLISCYVLALFALYYSLTCSYIRVLLKHVLELVDEECFPSNPDSVFYIYGYITRYMRNMDEQLSLPVFVSVFFTMIGLFWGGYRIAFNPNMTREQSLSLIIPLIFYLSVQLLIMVSASITNELANKAKSVMQCLPYRNLTQDLKKKYKFKKDLNQGNCLTLWNIYVMDRSLVITSVGTLLTYGILIGTLGKNT